MCLHIHTASAQIISIPKAPPHAHHGPLSSRKIKPGEQFNHCKSDNKACPHIQEVGDKRQQARQSGIAMRAEGAHECRQGQRQEVTFFHKSEELSVGEEGMVVAKDAWDETGNSRCHLQAFTTWSHRWFIIETTPALELGISSQTPS